MTDARRSDRQQTSDEWTAMVASKAARREPVTREHDLDCGNHSCRFARNKSGMRTNGPCTCVQDLLDTNRALADRLAASEQQVANMTARKDAAYLERNQAVAALAKCNDGPTDVTTAILTDRGQKYGAYIEQAQTAQRLKRILADVVATRVTPIRSDAAESMQMICTKLSRLVHGDPEHLDSWDDIAGYARLVADRLRGVER